MIISGIDPPSSKILQRGLLLVYFVYFFCGLTQCLEGVFLPEFKDFFHLSYQQQMYAVFAKNIPFLGSVAAGAALARMGYAKSLAIAMLLYSTGTFLLIPGLATAHYDILLCGFFLIGAGFTLQMVSGNPLLSLLGPHREASSRQNLGNALGAIAQTIGPVITSIVIPAAALTVTAKLPYVERLFAALSLILLLTALAALYRTPPKLAWSSSDDSRAGAAQSRGRAFDSRILFATAVLFCVLGFEASLFSFFRNYLQTPAIAGISAVQSQRWLAIFFLVFALGRLAGAWLQKRVRPAVEMFVQLILAVGFLIPVILARGVPALAAMIGLGFVVSVFFPTLYAMALEGTAIAPEKASGILTFGFLGCAVFPVLQGRLADIYGLQMSYALGFLVYIVAFLYVVWILRARPTGSESPTGSRQ